MDPYTPYEELISFHFEVLFFLSYLFIHFVCGLFLSFPYVEESSVGFYKS